MPTHFSVRKLFKGSRSKRVGNPEVQNDRHQPDGPTTPPKCEAETSVARPHNTSVTISIDEDSPKVVHSSVEEQQHPAEPPVITDAQGTSASPDAGTKNALLPAPAVKETSKAAFSSHVAQAQVPLSFLPVTNAQAGLAGANPQAKKPLLATEFAVQQTQAISTSQRLWNAAYDSLKEDDDTAELVRSYVKILTKVLKAEKASDSSAPDDISAELEDPIKRQTYMMNLVEEGLKKTATTSKITKGVGNVAQFILSAKGMVDAAIQNIPQAALPWAGVCVGLQILSNPGMAIKSNLGGITHVISRMDWYCALTEHLLDQRYIVDGFGVILHELEKRVFEMYKALLLYQMKSICSYYRNLVLVVLRGLTNWDDWDGDLQTVTDAEAAVQTASDVYNGQHAKEALGQLVRHAEGMEARLGDIGQTLQDFMIQQKDMHMDDKDTQCLQDLRVVDPQDDMKKIVNNKDDLLDDAYKWILSTREYAAFTNWSDDNSDLTPCRMLWIQGHAGTGKTMLLIGIIRKLSNQPFVLAPNVSYFFCQGTDSTLNNATATLRSLIWLLLVRQPYLISHLRKKYKDSGSALFTDGRAFYALSEVFQSMLRDPHLSPVYFAVDALDECDQTKPGLEELMQLISISLTLSDKVKWLVSSRPWVCAHGKPKNWNASRILVELDDQNLERPVNAYIDHKLSTLEGIDGYDADTLAEVSNEIRQRARNTFLWVALVFNQLNEVDGGYAVEIIKGIPPGLEELYGHMMTRIEKGKMRDPEYCKNVLVATSLAYRPLSLFELAILASVPPKMTETIVKKCDSFLTTREKTVYLIHQSAKDYLDKHHESKLQKGGITQGHADISRRSINEISKLKKNIYDLYPGSELKDITVRSPDPLEGLEYGCVYWVQHLQKSDAKLYDYDQIYLFLQKHLLHWLEALGWMRKISEGILAILLLESQVSTKESSNLYAFVHDAKRFALYNRVMIEQAPLQLYSSALVFAPAKGLIRREFEADIPAWIQIKPKVQTNWNALLQTLEGHSDWVSSVAFSLDGKQVVSGSYDKTVRLWDAVTGAALQTLEGHSGWVSSVAFSPDGKQVVSGSYDKTVRLWDAVTGAALQTLEGHSGSVTSVTFSPDGKQVVSGSYDGTVWLWDAVTGAALKTLDGHSGNVYSMNSKQENTLFVSKNWIIESGTKILWLPFEYRHPSCTAVWNQSLALGYSSGEVIIIGFEEGLKVI